MVRRACILGIALLAAASPPASAIPITQARGKLDCPELDNQQDCAAKAERALAATHRMEISRIGDLLRIRLIGGRSVTLKNDSDRAYNAVEWSARGTFVAIRAQYDEGNGWELLDRRGGARTEIYGYPLFSPDRTKFVAAAEDLDAGYTLNVLDVYRVTPRGIVQMFRALPNQGGNWAARDIVWKGESIVLFRRTRLENGHEVETPAKLVLQKGRWSLNN